MTRFGRLEAGYDALVRDAVAPVLDGVDTQRIGRVYLSSFAPAELCDIGDAASRVASLLRETFPGLDAPVAGPYKTGGEALHRALSENANDGDVLLVACEKMTHVDAATAAGLLSPRVNPVEKLYGATLPALGALVTRAYMDVQRVPYHAFHAVAVKNHANAALNPDAHFREPVTAEEVAASPMVADPLRRHHCAPMSDGAAAALLGARGEVSIRAWARGRDAALFHERTRLWRFESAARAARDAFARAGIGPGDVDVVEIHDAFSPFELINLEDMGFYAPGTAWRALAGGELDIGGRRAVNPSGGMKGRGHPIGVCGLASLVEMHAQLTGAAGARQHAGARLGLIQSAGGVSRDGYVFVLEAAT